MRIVPQDIDFAWTEIAGDVDSVGFKCVFWDSSVCSNEIQSVLNASASFQRVEEIWCQINFLTNGIHHVSNKLTLVQSSLRLEIIRIVHSKILIDPYFRLSFSSETDHLIID